jgi:hypothetical protein
MDIKIREGNITKTLEEAGIDKRNFYAFIKGDTRKLTQIETLKLCTRLGIKVKLEFELT